MLGYTHDPAIAGVWEKVPSSVRRYLERGFQREMAPLAELRPDDPARLQEVLQRLQYLETPNRYALEERIAAQVQTEYGDFVRRQLYLRLGVTELPEEAVTRPDAPSAEQGSTPPENLTFYLLRRELYNMLSQGTGWKVMQAFVQDDGDELARLDPQLPAIYRELHTLALRTQVAGFLQIDQIPASYLEASRRQMRAGREAVMIGFQRSHDGYEEQIGLGDVRGFAVGLNAWALVHEAMKAGYEMRTALEASQRSVLNSEERDALDAATGTALAEIRQQMYGQVWLRLLREFLQALLESADKPMNPDTYYSAVENLFALLPEMSFHRFLSDLGEWGMAPPDQQPAQIRKIQPLYFEYDIL